MISPVGQQPSSSDEKGDGWASWAVSAVSSGLASSKSSQSSTSDSIKMMVAPSSTQFLDQGESNQHGSPSINTERANDNLGNKANSLEKDLIIKSSVSKHNNISTDGWVIDQKGIINKAPTFPFNSASKQSKQSKQSPSQLDNEWEVGEEDW